MQKFLDTERKNFSQLLGKTGNAVSRTHRAFSKQKTRRDSGMERASGAFQVILSCVHVELFCRLLQRSCRPEMMPKLCFGGNLELDPCPGCLRAANGSRMEGFKSEKALRNSSPEMISKIGHLCVKRGHIRDHRRRPLGKSAQ